MLSSWCRPLLGLVLVGAAVVVGAHAGTGVDRGGVVDARVRSGVEVALPGCAGVGGVDRGGAGQGGEVALRRAGPARVGLQPVRLLTTGRLERGQRGVGRRAPDHHRAAAHAEADQVVVDGGPELRGGVDADVPAGPGALDGAAGAVGARGGVVDRDVVGDREAARSAGRDAFEVDAGADVVVDGVADDGAAGHGVVVDAVVAGDAAGRVATGWWAAVRQGRGREPLVVVADVVDDRVAVTAGIRLDAGVLVVVHPVAADDVARCTQVDAHRVADVAVRVQRALVAGDLVAGGAVGEVDPGRGVVRHEVA